MSEYSGTEVLYVNLSAETEALRLRAVANENRKTIEYDMRFDNILNKDVPS